MFTAAIWPVLPAPASAATRCSASTWSELYDSAQGATPHVDASSKRVNAWIDTSCAPGATPLAPPGALTPTAMPATCVPCRQSSATEHGALLPTAVDANPPPGHAEVPVPDPPAFM